MRVQAMVSLFIDEFLELIDAKIHESRRGEGMMKENQKLLLLCETYQG